MSLSAAERRALDAIEDGLAESCPSLAAMLATFSRLAANEEMPLRERVSLREPSVHAADHPVRRSHELAKMLTLWLVLAVAVVAASSIALTVSHGAKQTCGASFALVCAERTNTHRSRPAPHQPVPGRPAVSHGGTHRPTGQLGPRLTPATAVRS